jgi:hypothetical protein
LLGILQLALTAPSVSLPPSLAFVLILTTTGLVAGVAAPIPLLLRWTHTRVTHATLVGGVLGSLVVVALSGPALALELGWPLVTLGGLAAFVGTAVVATWLAESREGKRPTSALLTWTGMALMLAGVAQLVGSTAEWWTHIAIAGRSLSARPRDLAAQLRSSRSRGIDTH